LRDLLGDGALAWDATQETFARAFRHHKELVHDRARAVPWLFGVARNVSLEMRKARYRTSRVMTFGDADRACEKHASPENELLGREAARVVACALGKLSEDRRAMLLLRLDHDLSYEDIAELMGFSLSKVKVEIHRAREVLRETLEEYRRGGDR
jgi:RNA polymerase sigma-70 factor (ECF subfamily)